MRILFLAPDYLNLYQPILVELKKSGHEIIFIRDEGLPFDPYFHKNKIGEFIFRLENCHLDIDKAYIKYWDTIINKYNLLNERFDLFFCINGSSLHPYFLNLLYSKNPSIKKSLYIWDSDRYYNYHRNISFFDTIYTFDRDDSKKYDIGYLPFYCPMRLFEGCEVIEYDAFCIGSLHDDRLRILKQIACQLEVMGNSYLFKVVYSPRKVNAKNLLGHYFRMFFGNKKDTEEREYMMGFKKDKLLTTEFYSVSDYIDMLKKCRIVVDTDRPVQSGLTPRLIWAIAAGKQIITTNDNILLDPYCKNAKIWVVDRNFPQLSDEMTHNNCSTDDSMITDLRIDKWLSNFVC